MTLARRLTPATRMIEQKAERAVLPERHEPRLQWHDPLSAVQLRQECPLLVDVGMGALHSLLRRAGSEADSARDGAGLRHRR